MSSEEKIDGVSEDQIKEMIQYNDDMDYRSRRSYEVGTRPTPLSNNLLSMVGDLLQPQTAGFSQINLDMTFSYLDRFDICEVQNYSSIITDCDIFGLKKSGFKARSMLATLLNAKRSQNGKSMALFNTTVTQTKQELEDKTDKKTGWNFFNRKNKDRGEA